jgi:outer membrane protein
MSGTPHAQGIEWRGFMHLYGNLVAQEKSEQMENAASIRNGRAAIAAQGVARRAAVVLLGMTNGMPPGFAQQAPSCPKPGDKVLSGAGTDADRTALSAHFAARFLQALCAAERESDQCLRPTKIRPMRAFTNSVRLGDLVKDGKIYLSLSDALALALENNYDIAIARYDLDIADTDILRAKAGGIALGAPSGWSPERWAAPRPR